MPAEPRRAVVHSTRIADMIVTTLVNSTPAWMHQGVCATSSVNHFDPEQVGAALDNCARCPFTQQCLDYAREREAQNGVRGGTLFVDGVAACDQSARASA